jgi:hypothetical protein
MVPAAWAGLHYEELDIPLLLRGPGLGDLARQRGVAITGSDTARYAEPGKWSCKHTAVAAHFAILSRRVSFFFVVSH